MPSKNANQPYSRSYAKIKPGSSSAKPMASISSNGLAVNTLKTSNFNSASLLNNSEYIKATDIFERLNEWFLAKEELGPSATSEQIIDKLIADGILRIEPLTATERKEINNYSLPKSNNSRITTTGLQAGGWSEIPMFLRAVLRAVWKSNPGARSWYFPFASGTAWFEGIKLITTDSYFPETISKEIFDTPSGSKVSLLKLMGYDASGTEIIDQLSLGNQASWPKPYSKDILNTFQGLRPFTNETEAKNLLSITYMPFQNLASAGFFSIPASSGSSRIPLHKNPVSSADTYLIRKNQNWTIKLSDLCSINNLTTGTYTLSFYARCTSEVNLSGEETQITDSALRSVESAAINSKNTTYISFKDGIKLELAHSWHRYYYTFAVTAGSDISGLLEIKSADWEIKTSGWLLEKSDCPSPYDVRYHNWKIAADDIPMSFPAESLTYPIAFLLPCFHRTGNPENYAITQGTILYRQYIEDYSWTRKHLCSFGNFGVANKNFVTWGFEDNKAVLRMNSTDTTSVNINTADFRDTWLLNAITYKIENSSLIITWTVFGANPTTPLVNLSLTVSGISNIAFCKNSSKYQDIVGYNKTEMQFNCVLGSELLVGQGSSGDDPCDRAFGSEETEITAPCGDIFQDLLYTEKVLTATEIRTLPIDIFVIEDQQEPGNTNNSVLTIVCSPIEQGNYLISKVSQAYAENNSV